MLRFDEKSIMSVTASGIVADTIVSLWMIFINIAQAPASDGVQVLAGWHVDLFFCLNHINVPVQHKQAI